MFSKVGILIGMVKRNTKPMYSPGGSGILFGVRRRSAAEPTEREKDTADSGLEGYSVTKTGCS